MLQTEKEALVGHRNARLNDYGRRLLVSRVRFEGWSVAAAAEAQGVSVNTVYRWLGRFDTEGWEGLVDRSSRPHRSPQRTPVEVEERVCWLRQRHRWGPHRISWATGVPASTVYRILCRYQMNRLEWFDRPSRRRVRRYERDRPGELLHVDTKRIARIPDGGGWRFDPIKKGRSVKAGYEVLHTAVDDHSRLAYVEAHQDTKGTTAAGFLRRAAHWFAAHGVTVESVMTDNHWSYVRSNAFPQALDELEIRHVRIPPRNPQINGKVERFHRTLKEEWAYAQPYTSNTGRRDALYHWLNSYNWHRPHYALGAKPPGSRI